MLESRHVAFYEYLKAILPQLTVNQVDRNLRYALTQVNCSGEWKIY